MKRKISQLTNLVIAGSILFASGCSKNSSSTAVKTKSDILVSSTWKFSTAGVDQDNNGTIDVPLPAGTIESCITDNTITFKSDKTGVIDEGATKCDATAPQTSAFTWALSNNDTQLTVSTPILSVFGNDAKVIELSDTKFVLSKTVTVSGIPIPLPVIVVLVH
jgi:hypothetical protein